MNRDGSMQDARQLILDAFHRARASGKPDWDVMTTAALKSRLLNITGNSFTEADYGFGSFAEFISNYSELVEVDKYKPHPTVTLRDANTLEEPDSGSIRPAVGQRIRADLWQATVDYSSGATYVWDLNIMRARPAERDDPNPVIPTIIEHIDNNWRKEFVESVRPSLDVENESGQRTLQWAHTRRPTSYLPNELVHSWNEFRKMKVRHHLQEWFEREGLEKPVDFMLHPMPTRAGRDSSTEELREFIVKVVGEMTAQELSELRLPPKAVLRATRRR